MRDGLLQQRKPGRRLAPHPVGNADALSQAVGLGTRVGPERSLDLGGRRACRLSLLGSAQAMCKIAP